MYSGRPCPVKHYCDGVNLLDNHTKLRSDQSKRNETKEQIVARLRERIAEINSLSTYSPDSDSIEYCAAVLSYERLNDQLQPDEHLISRKNNKLRYLKYNKINDILTATVYVDKVVQYSLKFGRPCRKIIPQSYNGIADFVVADSRCICLMVINGVIYPHHDHINHSIKFIDYDNKVEVTIGEDQWTRIRDFNNYEKAKPRMLLEAKQILCDQYYAEWLEQYQYELKNLECTLDRLDYH